MKRDPPSVIAGPAEALCFSGGGKTNRFIRLKNIEHPLRNQGQWLSETRKLLRLNTEKRIRFLTHGLSQFTRKAKGNERWMRENLKKFPSSLSGSRDHSPFFLSPSITSPSDKVLTVLSAGRPNTLLPLHYLSLPSSRPCTHMLTRPFCLLIAHTLRAWRSTLGTFFKKPSCRWHVTSVLSKEKYIVWRLDSPQTVNIYTETMHKYWLVGIFWWDK